MTHRPTLDYRTPPPRPPDGGGVRWFTFGLATGIAITMIALPVLARVGSRAASGEVSNFVLVGLIAIPTLKFVLGATVAKTTGRSTFLSGILVSIALAPLIGIGMLFATCAGWI